MKFNAHDWGLFVLRLGAGAILFYFGCQKLLGSFGGPGFNGTLSFMGKLGFPAPLAVLAIIAEFFGSLALVVGLLTRVAAFGAMCTMAVAAYTGAANGGLAKAFSSASAGEANKIFFPLILMFVSLAILIAGPGGLSLDAQLFKGKGRRKK